MTPLYGFGDKAGQPKDYKCDCSLCGADQTSDQSAMYISVYKSQEDAENALDGRQKYVDAMGDLVHDVFYHEGDMDFAFLDPDMLKHEMVESL
jgi:hypothetical protein